MNLLWHVKKSCLVCSDVPSCPTCADDEICQMTTQSCTACPTTYCAKISSTTSSSSSSSSSSPSPSLSSSNTGAIVGGVVGGLAFLAILFFLLWYFYIRPKTCRAAYLAANTTPGTGPSDFPQDLAALPKSLFTYSQDDPSAQDEKTISNRNTTTSSHLSISTTSLDRSSTVIPIAYIPGVTTRVPLPQSLSPIPATPSSSTSSATNTSSPRIDRSSIATTSYRGSTAAVATATTVTAIPARPMLVDIGSSHTVIPPTYSPAAAASTPVAQTASLTNTPAAPAGRALTGLGLQAHLIPEEEYDDTMDDYQVHQVRRIEAPQVFSSTESSVSTHTHGALSSSSDIIVNPIPASDSSDSSDSDSSDSDSDDDYVSNTQHTGYEIHQVNTTTITNMAQNSYPGLVSGTPVGPPRLTPIASIRTSPTSSFVSYKSARQGSNAESSSTQIHVPPNPINPREDGPPLTSPFDDKFHI